MLPIHRNPTFIGSPAGSITWGKDTGFMMASRLYCFFKHLHTTIIIVYDKSLGSPPVAKKRCEEGSISTPKPSRQCGPKKLFELPMNAQSGSPSVSVSCSSRTIHCIMNITCTPTQIAVWGCKQKTRYFHLSRSLKKLGKYIGRGKKHSIVSAIMNNPHLHPHVVVCCSQTGTARAEGYLLRHTQFYSPNEIQSST